MAAIRCLAQWRAASAVLYVEFGAGRQQLDDEVDLVVPGSAVQRCVAVVVSHVRIRSVFCQRLDDATPPFIS